MSNKELNYLSEKVASDLRDNIEDNLECYKTDGFAGKSSEFGWSIKLTGISADLTILKSLDSKRTAEADRKNSMLVWQALGEINPAIGTENRFWTRICHLEGFEYSKNRWLSLAKEDSTIVEGIETHFFALTMNQTRDDNSISRLWWNAYIAKQVMPSNQEKALELIVNKADIRSNLIERVEIFRRQKLARAILEKMDRDSKVYETEDSFREFMKEVNAHGGGIVFEEYSNAALKKYLDAAWNRAHGKLNKKN